MRFPIYSLLVPTLLILCLSSADAHLSSGNTHVRRALSNKLQRRQLLGLPDSLDPVVSGLRDGLGLPDGSDQTPTEIPPTPTPSSDSFTDTSTATSSSTTDTDTTASTISTSTQDTISTTAPATTASSTKGGLLDPVTSLLGPVVSPVTSLLSPTSISSSDSSTSVPDPSTPAPTPSSTSDSVTLPPSSEPTPTPLPTPTSSSTSEGGGIISDILSSLTSIVLPPSSTPSSSDAITSAPSSDPTTAPTPTPSPSSSEDGGIISDILSSLTSIVLPPSSTPSSSDVITSAPSSVPTPPPTSSSSDDGGILTSIISSLTSVVLDPPTSLPTSDPPTSLPPTSVPTSVPPTSVPISDPPTSIPTSVPVTDPPTSIPTSVPITDPPTSIPTSVPISDPPTSIPTSSITISFPTTVGSSDSVNGTSSGTEITSVPTALPTISINSDLSFVLTESSLIFTSIPTTAVEQTLTDPDQATTTVNTQVGPTPATTLSVAPLPTGIPGRIYPKVQLDLSQDLSGYTLISILFNQELNWPFVVTNQISSSQIFAWLPAIISNALGTSPDQVKTWALQVYVPASYHGPADAIQLGTMWLGYIPTDQVDTLAAQIKAKKSPFYIGIPDPVATALASRVNSGFSLNAVADPNLNTNGPGGGTKSNASSDSSKSRQDAIIGVVTALGVIALLVLAFLVYRSMKRRRELAHRRLSDPPDAYVAGARPDGREFDQDSVGAPRRRSFYYAEDSLRGFQSPQQQTQEVSGQGMMQRRNVMPAAISAPILQESSMNW